MEISLTHHLLSSFAIFPSARRTKRKLSFCTEWKKLFFSCLKLFLCGVPLVTGFFSFHPLKNHSIDVKSNLIYVCLLYPITLFPSCLTGPPYVGHSLNCFHCTLVHGTHWTVSVLGFVGPELGNTVIHSQAEAAEVVTTGVQRWWHHSQITRGPSHEESREKSLSRGPG